jgi:hypothetical protein
MEVSGQLHVPPIYPPPPRERASGTHWIGGWVGPRTVLDAVVMRKISSPRQESNSRTPIVQPVAQRYTDWAITTLSGSTAPRILNLGTTWRGVVSFTPRPLHSQGNNPGTQWIGGLESPTAGLDAVTNRKTFFPVRIPATILTELPQHAAANTLLSSWPSQTLHAPFRNNCITLLDCNRTIKHVYWLW